MNGREVFKFVSRKVPGSLEAVLSAANLKAEDVDWLLMHQANKRIIDAVAERLNIPQEKVRTLLASRANSSWLSLLMYPVWCYGYEVTHHHIREVAVAGNA